MRTPLAVLTRLPAPTDALTVTPTTTPDATRLPEPLSVNGRQPSPAGQGLSAALQRAQQQLQRFITGKLPR
jgi:hypothetical protein